MAHLIGEWLAAWVERRARATACWRQCATLLLGVLAAYTQPAISA